MANAESETLSSAPSGSSASSGPDSGRLADRAAQAAAAVKERVRSVAGDEVVDQASEAALEIKDQVDGQVRDLADEQISRGAAGMESVARAVHGAARDFEKTLPQAAGLIHHAAEQLERASSTVRDSSVEDIVTLVDDFARRQPVAFFGASVLAGFVLSRFLKSSGESRGMGEASHFPPRRASSEGV